MTDATNSILKFAQAFSKLDRLNSDILTRLERFCPSHVVVPTAASVNPKYLENMVVCVIVTCFTLVTEHLQSAGC